MSGAEAGIWPCGRQISSFAYGNVKLHNPSITREDVERMKKFQGRIEQSVAHELALNPDHFGECTDEQVLSTLVHEMVHVWQETHGTPPRRCYHDREWAGKMKEVGLQPTETGQLGGPRSRPEDDHYIIPDGRYAAAFRKLEASGFRLHWQARPEDGTQAIAKRESKTKFTARFANRTPGRSRMRS